MWPVEEIEAYARDTNSNKLDLHLVFEYAEGDTFLDGRFRAPRSNRFYFVHDPNGGKLKQLEAYHSIIDPGISRHMFGGYQLLQRLDYTQVEDRLSK